MGENMVEKSKKEKLIEAATLCFAEKGYHSTTVDDIAAHAGMTKGGVYWYFRSKREIFMAILEENIIINRAIWDKIDRLSNELSPKELLFAGGMLFIERIMEDPFLQRLHDEIRAEAVKDPAVREKLFENISTGVGYIGRYFEKAIKREALRVGDFRRLSFCIVMTIMGLGNAYWMTGRRLDPKSFWREFVDDLFRGIGVPEREVTQ